MVKVLRKTCVRMKNVLTRASYQRYDNLVGWIRLREGLNGHFRTGQRKASETSVVLEPEKGAKRKSQRRDILD